MTRQRSLLSTAVGVLLTAIMLFPLYWMVNVSLTQPDGAAQGSAELLPGRPDLRLGTPR